MATLIVWPGRRHASSTLTITFQGVGTAWKTTAPTFSATGTPTTDAAWHIGTRTVLSDTLATLVVTAGAKGGPVTWTDSTTSATCRQTVGAPRRLVFPNRYRGRQ